MKLVALFGPEHGIRGVAKAGEKIASSVDSATGVPVYSLYGDIRAPTADMLKDIDVLLYDIQDVGARVYTFQWTMALAAEAAGKAGKTFLILDRPNPIRADRIDGGILDTAFKSLVGLYPVALRYGFTPGELGHYLAASGKLKADVRVAPMQGYRRSMWYEETGLPQVNPSPNLRNVDASLLYTGTVFFEGVNISEGAAPTIRLRRWGRAGSPTPARLPPSSTRRRFPVSPSTRFHARWKRASSSVARRSR